MQFHSRYFDIANPDKEKRGQAIDSYKKRIEYPLEIRAEQVVIHPGGGAGTMYFRTEEEIQEGGVVERNAECLGRTILEAGKYIIATHLHDSRCSDSGEHYLPGRGLIKKEGDNEGLQRG